jgi:hypothetical protein
MAMASKELGCFFVGAELDREFCELAGRHISGDDAIRRAWTFFKKRADDRVVKVQQVDEDVWDEDVAALPPDGPEWVPS